MKRIKAVITMLAAMLGLLGAGLAQAAGPACSIKGALPAPHLEGANDHDPQRTVSIGSYTLSLIWMPQKCRRGDDNECDLYRETLGGGGRRDGFTLHGLWPDGTGADWPQWCKPAALLPPAVIAEHVCSTPSPQLLQHEWSKHGTCMEGLTPERYFTLSTRLAALMRMPDLVPLSYKDQTAHGVAEAIAAANPGMTADMMRLDVDKQGWLEEVWFCLGTNFRPQVCPAGQGGARGQEKVLIWRGRDQGAEMPRTQRHDTPRGRY